MLRPIAFSLGALLVAVPAFAADADLETTITEPSGVDVYQSATWSVTVDNVGTRHANSVDLEILLPETGTSPTVHVMGDLSNIDAACSQVGTTLSCALGRIRKNESVTVSFDIALPASSGPLVIEADATTTTSESNTANNIDSVTATLGTIGVSFTAPFDAINKHCTGTSLTSFYECELYPSSITSHEVTFNANGSITFTNPAAPPGYTGTWSSSAADQLSFTYFNNGTPVAVFDGVGVDTGCWEGVTDFLNGWGAPYRVCVQ